MTARLRGVLAALGRARRRAGFDRNPMRRREDRLQTAAVTALVAAALVFAPWAATIVAGPVYSHGVRAEQNQAAARHKATAKIFDPGPTIPGLKVTWRDAHGVQHTGDLQGNGTLGSTITIWVDRSEHVVSPPHTRTQTLADTTMAGLSAVLAILTATLIAVGLLIRRLNKARYRRWDSDWAAVDGRRGRHPEQP